jgi:hypothetical protein
MRGENIENIGVVETALKKFVNGKYAVRKDGVEFFINDGKYMVIIGLKHKWGRDRNVFLTRKGISIVWIKDRDAVVDFSNSFEMFKESRSDEKNWQYELSFTKSDIRTRSDMRNTIECFLVGINGLWIKEEVA